ncbi:MAG: hypothetical protein ABIJ96_16910 [Elusimicrobiota bacterium]
MRNLLPLLLCVAALAGCAGGAGKAGGDGGEPTGWARYRTVGYRVASALPDTPIEEKWLKRMFQLELERSKLFSAVLDLEESTPADLEISARIVRVKRWRRLKLFVDVEFYDGKSKRLLERRQFITKSTTGLKGLRDQHKSAGQTTIYIVRKAIAIIRARR